MDLVISCPTFNSNPLGTMAKTLNLDRCDGRNIAPGLIHQILTRLGKNNCFQGPSILLEKE